MWKLYEYIWIHMIDRYDMKKESKIWFVIEYQCNVWVNSTQIDINSKSTLWGSSCSGTVTLTQITSDTICTSGMTGDATSGREKLLKNFTQNAFVWKYPSWHMKIIGWYVRDIYKISFSHMKI